MTALPTPHVLPSVVELRRYELRPGQREDLVKLFEGALIDPQEEVGAHVLGQFRDLDDPDAFVWLRGFEDLSTRSAALRAFYRGPEWAAQRETANATMVNSDDVLLMRPVGVPGVQGLGWGAAATDEPVGLFTITVYLLRRPVDPALVDLLDRCATPALLAAGARVLGWLGTQTEDDPSPLLPVREGVHALVLLASFTGTEAHIEHMDALARSALWQTVVLPGLEDELVEPPRTSRLAPTGRSRLQHPIRSSAVSDFAFLEGTWTVANHRRSTVGHADEPWTSFTSTGLTKLHLGGVAVVEELDFSHPPWQGLTVRTLDLRRGVWSIVWVSSRDGVVEPPLRGGFDGEVGHFYGETVLDGRSVGVRFTWTRQGPCTARWSQAFTSREHPWHTNWVMEFSR